MISPLNGNTPISMPQVAAQAPSPSKSTGPAPSLGQDTVTISHAAQQAVHSSGDVDHDGDSH